VNVAVIEVEQGILNTSAALQITRHRPPARVEIEEIYPFLQINSTVSLQLRAYDEQDFPVVDGTVLALSTSLGILPPNSATVNGIAEAIFATGSQVGAAHITAQTTNGISATRIISITPPMIEQIVLSATVSALPADGVATTPLMATVLDAYGAPVANQVVRIGVEGGGDQAGSNQVGTVNGSEVVTGTTNASGQFQVTFKSGTVAGEAGLRAELILDGVSTERDRTTIMLGAQQGREILMPLIRRQ
jgi:hypothetical protein